MPNKLTEAVGSRYPNINLSQSLTKYIVLDVSLKETARSIRGRATAALGGEIMTSTITPGRVLKRARVDAPSPVPSAINLATGLSMRS